MSCTAASVRSTETRFRSAFPIQNLCKNSATTIQPDTATVITQEHYQSFSWLLPARDMLLVDNASADRLTSVGIGTIGVVARAGRELLKSILGWDGETI